MVRILALSWAERHSAVGTEPVKVTEPEKATSAENATASNWHR
ncbi:hypothetical protein PV963_03650 [Streptomyces coeruleorubidus]|nr:hypothetical protein [Streptomyces coeruleorubidus]WDV49528.1 hypothetical protein PV963_03650 [Streptomyces coeruleorubidus]